MSYTGQTPDTEPAPDWRKSAVCCREDAEIWFPKSGNTSATDYAKSICMSCPVRRPCLEAALAEEGGCTRAYRFGVRGGKSSGQRFAIYTARRKRTQRVAV